MKAPILKHPGQPESLKLAGHPKPILQPDEVLVKVAAVGLNPVDYKFYVKWSRTQIIFLTIQIKAGGALSHTFA